MDDEIEAPIDALEVLDDEDEQTGDAKPTTVCVYTVTS